MKALIVALCLPCQISDAGVTMIQHFEGYSPFLYEDVGGLKTVGFGHLILPGEAFEEPFLPDEADILLRNDLKRTERGVNGAVRVALRQNQYDSLVSFTFNVGTGAMERSTLLRKVNAGRNDEVPPQFLRWDKVGGKQIPGLTRRRKEEAAMYGATQ